MTINNKNKRFAYLLTVFLGIGIFFLALPAQANWATDIFGGLISLIINALGRILVLVMQALVAVAQYSNFIHAPAISNGWSVVRDVCNMFFVLILLIIAFATILRVENYSYKKWLPKLILMAILINFSKTICGLLIDFAQIVMLTFVNAFKDMAAGNLISNLGITEILTLADNSKDVGAWEIAGAYVLGLIYILIALVVIVTMLAMLVMRIVMIWIYVVLSPAAYLMSAFPGGQKYSSQWWTEFSKNLIVGPVLAFFIWLSFVSLQTQNINTDFPVTGPTDSAGVAGEAGIASNGSPTAATEASTPGVFIKFVIAIGMLIGGLKISQEIGGAAGGIAGKGMSKITKGVAFAGGVGLGALALAKRGAKNIGMAAINQKSVRGALDTVGAQKGALGQVLRFTGVRRLAREGSLILGKHKSEVEEKAKKKIDAFKKVGATETLASIASGKAATLSQKAAKREARKSVIIPEEHFDKTRGVVGLANAKDKEEAELRLNELDLKKDSPSLNQIAQLGKSGINLSNVPLFRAMLEKNAEARGAYNSGQRDGGLRNYVVGKKSNGEELTGRGRYGIPMTPDRVSRAMARKGETTYALRTTSDNEGDDEELELPESPEINAQRKRIAEVTGSSDNALIERTRTKVDSWNVADKTDHFKSDYQLQQAFSQSQDDHSREQAEKNKPGSGSLSVSGFARGKQEYMGVDFNKLDPEVQKSMKTNLEPGQDLKNIKGVATQDKGEISKIASSIIAVIDSEIKAIKTKDTRGFKGKTIDKAKGILNKDAKMSEGSLSYSDKKRVADLEAAKAKLKNPKKLDNLELINSSAVGYNSAKDVATTIIHEDMHGRRGIQSESDTDYLTEKATTGSFKERDEIRSGGPRFYEHLENKMDIDRGVTRPVRRQSVKAVLAAEEDDEELNEYSLRASEQAGAEITNVTNVTNNVISKDDKTKTKEAFKSNPANNANNAFMTYYFKRFITSLNKVSSTVGDVSKSASSAPTPEAEEEKSGEE